MEARPDLTTRAGRIQHVREKLATRYGNLSFEKFAKYVGAAEAEIFRRDYSPYTASSAMRWEDGSAINSDALYGIARLGGVRVEWLIVGTGEAQDDTQEPIVIAALPPDPPKQKELPKKGSSRSINIDESTDNFLTDRRRKSAKKKRHG